MTDDNEYLEAAAVLGDDTKAFLETDVGRYLTERIEDDIEAAKSAFADADLEDEGIRRKLQMDLRAALRIKSYLIQVVTDGNNALEVLMGEND